MQEAIRTLERRVNQLGVAEPVIAEHGEQGDQILVQLPGVTDVEQAKRVMQTTAQLPLKLVEDQAASREALLQKHGGKVPDNMEVVQGQGDEPGQPVFYLVRRESVDHRPRPQERARGRRREQPAGRAASRSTRRAPTSSSARPGRNVGRQLAIILDGTVESRARHPARRSATRARSPAASPTEEADELAKVLRAGALPATLQAPAGADGRRLAGQGLDPRRASSPRPPAWPSSPSSCWSTTGSRA